MNILVVDDEKTARSLLVETLKSNGEKVFEAEDGRQALAVLEKEKIDLVLTDRAMPVLDGIGLLQALRDRNSTVPVVMISAYEEEKL
jgi:CheY-like chemotaxis protein